MQVSVIIPVFNAAPFLDKCIQSALDQPQTGEVILIDDRSTDGSWEKCEEWLRKDKKVRLFRNEGIKGAAAARNVGLRNASCEFIAFLDADDYYLDHAFKNINLDFQTHIDADAIIYTTLVHCKSGQKVKTPGGHFDHNQIIGPKSVNKMMSINAYFKFDMYFIPSLIIRHNTINIIGFFDTSLLQTQDTDFIIRLLQVCKCYSSNNLSPISVYYLHERNRINKFDEALYYRQKLYKKHFNISLKKLKLEDAVIFFKFYVENYYLHNFSRNSLPKLLVKIILVPYFFYHIIKNENEKLN